MSFIFFVSDRITGDIYTLYEMVGVMELGLGVLCFLSNDYAFDDVDVFC